MGIYNIFAPISLCPKSSNSVSRKNEGGSQRQPFLTRDNRNKASLPGEREQQQGEDYKGLVVAPIHQLSLSISHLFRTKFDGEIDISLTGFRSRGHIWFTCSAKKYAFLDILLLLIIPEKKWATLR